MLRSATLSVLLAACLGASDAVPAPAVTPAVITPAPALTLEPTGEWQPMHWPVLGHSTAIEDWHGKPAPWNAAPVLWDLATHAPDPTAEPLTHAYPLHWLRLHTGNTYRWRDVIGPVAQRKEMPAEYNTRLLAEPGFDEALRWAESLPQPPQVSFIVGPNQEVDDLHDWVAYVNATTGPMAELRAANGHPAPYHVRSVELGNEVDWKGRDDVDIMRADSTREQAGMMRVEDYIRMFRPRIAAMRAADPNIKLYAHAKTSPWPMSTPKWADWHRAIIAELGDQIDGISIHPYYDGYPVPVVMRSVDTLVADVRAHNATGGHQLSVWISEHGKWWGNHNDGQTWGLAGSISTADFLIDILQRPEIEAASNWCYAHTGPWRVIDRDPKTGKRFGTGIHWTYALLNSTALGELHPLQAVMPAGVTFPAYDYAVNALWFREPGSTRQALLAINRSPDQPFRLSTTIPLAAHTTATLRIVTAERLDVTNTRSDPDAVHLTTSDVPLVPDAQGHLSVELPPKAVVSWSWNQWP